MDIIDIGIIGAGVAGLYCAYCCKTKGFRYIIFDSLPYAGGQCMAFYPDKEVYGIPGMQGVLAKNFVDNLLEQCIDTNSDILLNSKIEIIRSKDLFIVRNSTQEYRFKYLVLATGLGTMKPAIPANIKGIDKLIKSSDFIQFYCMNNDIYKNKSVVIAGGGNSAIDFAINISRVANKVVLIHRRDKLDCDSNKLALLHGVEIMLEQHILELKQNIIITNKKTINADYIIFCYGFIPDNTKLTHLINDGLRLDNELIRVDFVSMETSLKHCYAIGDVVIYPRKKKNILSCCFEANRAIDTIRAIEERIW